MKLQEELKSRGVPDVMKFSDGRDVTADNWEERRAELLAILRDKEYGNSPEPVPVKSSLIERRVPHFAGKGEYYRYRLDLTLPDSCFSYPLQVIKPRGQGKFPLFIFINFRPGVPDEYFPAEEIVERGYACAMIYYNDVALDANDGFASGIGALYRRDDYSWGKIGMWAWSMSRALDFLTTLDWVDNDNIACIGHSRLGKTSLWCGANDTRIKYVISNDSGCSGAAITRAKTGEHVANITKVFPAWFCKKYPSYSDDEDNMPFDQNFLVAASAPRHVIIGSALEDSWADPYSEMLSAVSADDVWKMLGLRGFICEDREPKAGDRWYEGDVGYHLRAGTHFLSRTDWNNYMDFIDSKRSAE